MLLVLWVHNAKGILNELKIELAIWHKNSALPAWATTISVSAVMLKLGKNSGTPMFFSDMAKTRSDTA